MEHVLIIDPNPEDVKALKQRLQQEFKCVVTMAGRMTIGVEELKTKHKVPIDFIISKSQQPDAENVDHVLTVHRSALRIPLLIVTADDTMLPGDPCLMFMAYGRGADEYVTKKYLSDRFHEILWLTEQRFQNRLRRLDA